MKRNTIVALLIASVILVSTIAIVEAQYPGTYGQQQQYGQPYGQQQQYPQYGQQQQQYPGGGYGQPQQPQQPAAPKQISIPKPPDKIVANKQYGNTDRMAIIGEAMTQGSGDNANVYLSESGGKVTVNVNLKKASDVYEIAPYMANLTYGIIGALSITDLKSADVMLKVYDTTGNQVMDAMFSGANNKWDYFKVPEATNGGGQQPSA
jgi:hypothetical protein